MSGFDDDFGEMVESKAETNLMVRAYSIHHNLPLILVLY